jgi:glycosyltransferase involved in cell wall biosynthesis
MRTVKKRKVYSAEFKAKIGLEALRGEKPVRNLLEHLDNDYTRDLPFSIDTSFKASSDARLPQHLFACTQEFNWQTSFRIGINMATLTPLIEISIVVPMHNEAATIESLHSRLQIQLKKLDIHYEIICVNDGSTDDTLAVLIKQQEQDPHIRLIDLSRNFGKEVALSAGLDYSTGAAVIPIDADLQDPPELLPEMIARWREGYDVVYATRRSRQNESVVKKTTANLFYRLLNRISDVEIPRNTGDFRLMDRCVVDALKRMPERNRFMKGLFSWVGFKQTAIYFDRDPRLDGETSWNYLKLWRLAIDGITSFSATPLKIWSYVGLFLSLTALAYAAFLFIRVLVDGVDVPGYASMMVVLLFIGGIQFITLGVMGEYLGRIFTEVKGRPLYLVKETRGFEKEE